MQYSTDVEILNNIAISSGKQVRIHIKNIQCIYIQHTASILLEYDIALTSIKSA